MHTSANLMGSLISQTGKQSISNECDQTLSLWGVVWAQDYLSYHTFCRSKVLIVLWYRGRRYWENKALQMVTEGKEGQWSMFLHILWKFSSILVLVFHPWQMLCFQVADPTPVHILTLGDMVYYTHPTGERERGRGITEVLILIIKYSCTCMSAALVGTCKWSRFYWSTCITCHYCFNCSLVYLDMYLYSVYSTVAYYWGAQFWWIVI